MQMVICGVKNLLQLQIHKFTSVHSSDWGQDILNKHPRNVQHHALMSNTYFITSFQFIVRYINTVRQLCQWCVEIYKMNFMYKFIEYKNDTCS